MVQEDVTTVLPPERRVQIFDRMLAMYRLQFGHVAASEAHVVQMTHDNLDEARSREQLEALAAATGLSLSGKRLLEVGSGVGLTVAVARRIMGAEAYGIEPGKDEYDGTLSVSWDILDAAGIERTAIREGVGESIPFPDSSFDIVYSSNVLEHVDDPPRVVSEIVRVLKLGGVAQIVVPNYGSWWEGHYGILWPPHLPGWAGKLYVGLLGRDPAFIDTLQLVTRGKLERWLVPHRDRIEVLGWGVETWEARVRGLAFAEYSALGRLKAVLRIVHRLRLVSAVVAVGKLLHWETPLILTFRRQQ